MGERDATSTRYGDDAELTRLARRALVRTALALVVAGWFALVLLGLILWIPSVVVVVLATQSGPVAASVAALLFLVLAVVVGKLWFDSYSLTGADLGRHTPVVATSRVPETHDAVQQLRRLSDLADVPVPGLVQAEAPGLNANARCERDGSTSVHITTAALAELPPDEREAVLAHELFHLAHGDVRLVQRLEALASFVEGQTRSDLVQAFVLSGVRGLSRQRELAADRAAVLLTGRPTALESAVRRCAASRAAIPERDLRSLGRATFVSEQRSSEARFRTHPTLAERAESIARAATDLGRR